MGNRTYLNKVFWISAIIVSILVVFGASFPKLFAKGANAAFGFTTYSFGWFYLAAVFFFVLFLLFLMGSKYGKIRLERMTNGHNIHSSPGSGCYSPPGSELALCSGGLQNR